MDAELKELRRVVLSNVNDLVDEVNVIGERFRTSLVNTFINNSIDHYVRYINSYYQGYLSTTLAVNALAGVRSYALGHTFRTPIYQVRRIIDNVDYPLRPMQTYSKILITATVPNPSWLPTYELEGNNIVFSTSPASDEAGAVLVKHQMRLDPLVADNDELDDQLYDLKDVICLRATKRALQSKDVSGSLKSIVGWADELKEAERTMNFQISERYVAPDAPEPIVPDYYY